MSKESQHYVLDFIKSGLESDGFLHKAGQIYVKNFDKNWRGWIALSSGSSSISPRIGVMNLEIHDALYHVLKEVYAAPDNSPKKTNLGPPTVMTLLAELIGDPGAVSRTASWSNLNDYPAETAAKDLMEAIREKGYEFIRSNLTLESLTESALHYNKFGHAQQYSTPILLMRLGKVDLLNKFVKPCHDQYDEKFQNMAVLYKTYINKMAEHLNFDADKIEW
ncbi:MAG TPA: hypothetical protein VNT30_16685 [Stellaceae bacterium]|nr:hypothetical protein [Stellaceae bacterium]